ncbi:hypothetical protein F383_06362 [Gossypium arboreum]|uniref:Uncharacterized protein n=1 Tax=Gossypium arboreum TaxID=29729 RepID=A0A0B0PHU6_GOSAR|nr:hypothetical protein F383_06362 [Gossypium arboreum]
MACIRTWSFCICVILISQLYWLVMIY